MSGQISIRCNPSNVGSISVNYKLYFYLYLTIQESNFATRERMEGMLSMALEELEDVPLYYEIPRLTNICKLSQEKLTFYTSAILNAGYKFSLRLELDNFEACTWSGRKKVSFYTSYLKFQVLNF